MPHCSSAAAQCCGSACRSSPRCRRAVAALSRRSYLSSIDKVTSPKIGRYARTITERAFATMGEAGTADRNGVLPAALL